MLPLSLPHHPHHSIPSNSVSPPSDSSIPRRPYFHHSDHLDEDQLPSPLSPHSTHNYHYDHRPSLDSEMYENNSYTNSSSYSPVTFSSHRLSPPINISSRHSSNHPIPPPPPYLSGSPSPVDLHPHPSLPHPLSAPHSQDHFPASSYPSHLPLNTQYRSLRPNGALNKHSHHHHHHHLSPFDHRRMSEPALFGNSYATPTTDAAAGRYQQFQFAINPSHSSSRSSSLHRGLSTGSLRDLNNHHNQHHLAYPPSHNHSSTHLDWKSEDHLDSFHNGSDEPLSPLNPSFSGCGDSPPLGTSASSNTPLTVNLSRPVDHIQPPPRISTTRTSDRPEKDARNSNSTNKTYSFVSLPGNAVKKRPRRRYDEIERLYQCSWPECNKAYGTLNHLNAHVTMQKHGQKRSPNEFKELRKQWRKAKKESEEQSRPPRRAHDNPSPNVADFPHPHINQSSQSPREQPSHPQPLGSLPTSVNVPSIAPDGHYSGMDLPVEEIRFPLDNRDRFVHHDRERESERERERESDRDSYLAGAVPISAGARQRYPSSWQPIRAISHGYAEQDPDLALSLSSSNPHHQTSPPAPSLSTPPIGRLGVDAAMDRLPADSTLLTPLPGYQPPSLLPQLDERQVQGQERDHTGLVYPAQSYNGIYEETKPGTDHINSKDYSL